MFNFSSLFDIANLLNNGNWLHNVTNLQKEWSFPFQENNPVGKLLELAFNISKLFNGENKRTKNSKASETSNSLNDSPFSTIETIGPNIKRTLMGSLFSAVLPVFMMGFI